MPVHGHSFEYRYYALECNILSVIYMCIILLVVFVSVSRMLTFYDFCISFLFSEVDLIASLYDKAAKSPGLEKVDPKGYKFTSKWNPRTLPNFKFKRFWKKYRGKLTFYFSGQIIPQTKPIPIFSIYHKRKLLPYFETLIDFQKGKVIIRYQGVTSFQRSFILLDSPLQTTSGAIIQINNNVVTIQLDCLPSKSVKLRQKIAPIPRSSKIALQDFKSKEKIIVSINIGYINLFVH